MKFALLGVDDDALDLVGRLCRAQQHELRVAYDAVDHLETIRTFAPRVETGDAPESLLARQDIDAVIVANSPDQDERVRQLRTLVQGGLRLVVVLPMCDSLSAYELEMVRTESGSTIIPYGTGCGHPAIERLADMVRAGSESPIGKIEQIVFERAIPQRDRDAVIPQLCRDAHFVGKLIGDIEGVSATGDRDDPYKNLSVVLNGSSGLTTRWNVVPTEIAAHASVSLLGERGKALLEIPANAPWNFSIEQSDQPAQTWPAWNPAEAVISELNGQRAGLGSWFDACRDLEIADHVAASLRRRRTIEIRRDGNPEVNAFKGIMAAGGCLILMICLLVILGFAVVEGVRMPMLTSAAEALEMRDQEKPRWHILLRLWPVYPLLAFLALQFLLMVAKSGRNEQSDRDDQ